jgi:hypothetical protein
MPLPLINEPPRLGKDVALQVAHVAGVPSEECDQFCELVQGTVQRVWELDRRARSSKPGQALDEAAQAARALHKAFLKLNKEDREWLESFLAPNSYYMGRLRELPLTIWRLAHLFSTAIGKSLPERSVQAISPKKRDWRQRTVKDVTFENFLTHLFVDVAETGGKLTFTKDSGTGTLIVALDILRPHLPEGVLPKRLPLGTIQKVITNWRNFYAGYAEFGIFPPNNPRRRRTK